MQGSRSALLRPALALAAALASGCLRESDPVLVDLEIEDGDLVIFGQASEAGTPALESVSHTIVRGSRLEHAFTGAAGKPVMVFRLRARDFVRGSGEVTALDFESLDVRLEGRESKASLCAGGCDDALEACEDACTTVDCRSACRQTAAACRSGCGAEPGSCGRCLVPAVAAPQIINDGDSCLVPPFAEGRLFRPRGSGFERSDSPDDLAALDAARTRIRVDWPHPCACSAEESPLGFDDLSIRPVSPPGSEIPFDHWAEGPGGLFAGARDRAAIAIDRATGRTEITEFPDIEADTRAFAALRSGSFLLASTRFGETTSQGYRLDLFRVSNGRLLPPEELEDIGARPGAMKHLGSGPNAPLFLLGSKPGLTQPDPAMFACGEEPFACTGVPIEPCAGAGDVHALFPSDAVMLDNGIAVALASKATYVKAPGGPNPSPSDVWTCARLPQENFLDTQGEPVRLESFGAIAASGDRAFLCALVEDPPCDPYFPVVLTSTFTADGGRASAPVWRIVAEGPDWTDCRKFLPVPGRPDQVRLLVSNGVTIDFASDGREVARGNVNTLFGPDFLPWNEIRALETGTLLARTRYNGAFVSDGVAPFSRIYGPPSAHRGNYTTVVPLPGGGFVSFGTEREITRVELAADGGAEVSYVEDRNGLYRSSDIIRDAVLDSASTAQNAGAIVLLAVGYSDGSGRVPLARRFFLDATGSTITSAEDVPIAEDLDGLAIQGVTEVGPGRFVAILEDTRILRVEGTNATEVPVGFDAVDTPGVVEVPPTFEADRCSGRVPPVDAFGDVHGGQGVAWAAGRYGMVVRVVGDRAERFMPTVALPSGGSEPAASATIRAVRATCPDRVLLAGDYRVPSDDTGRTLRAWKVVPKNAPEDECVPSPSAPAGPSGGEGEALEIRELVEDAATRACLNVGDRGLFYSSPRAILPDGQDAAIVLDNGTILRLTPPGPGEPRRLKVPFFVLSAFEDRAGQVLFGGYESRLAVGRRGPGSSD